MIKILFLAADPGSTSLHALHQEVQAIDARIQGAVPTNRLKLVPDQAIRLDELSILLLRERPRIVHFSGRDQEAAQIKLLGDDNTPRPIAGAALAERFRILRDEIRAVVLDACYTVAQARGIAKSIDCSIGMTSSMSRDQALDYAALFYAALATGRSVREAYDLGCARLSEQRMAKSAIRLHKRWGVRLSRIVLIRDMISLNIEAQHNGGQSQPDHVSATFRAADVAGPPCIFISYSHKDRPFLERLQMHLRPLEREGLVERWDDTRIGPGMRWHEEVKGAINNARVAVLLVSADFLASDFIANEELPPLLAKEQARGLIVMPVIISPCGFSRTLSLAQFQAVNADLRPVNSMPEWEQEQLWQRLVGNIEHTLLLPADPRPATWWNVPPKNPVFTARERSLEQVRTSLAKHFSAALFGMPGVGKTQTAIEFAHRYRTDYRAVLWIRAGSAEDLTSGLLSLASVLGLPERSEPNQALVVRAVQDWLAENDRWLLIVDGADDLSLVLESLPRARTGHLLLTTRDPAVASLAPRLELLKMSPDEGALLLLRRAAVLLPKATLDQVVAEQRADALALSEAVDGLPLALSQAGAYIVERSSSPGEYLGEYEARGRELRARRPEVTLSEHASVTTTFSMAFAKLEATSAPTADLLRLSAMLALAPIPEEIFLAGAPELGERLGPACADRTSLIANINIADRMSLLRRSPESRTVILHRVVREVIRDAMTDDEERIWAQRATLAVRRAFPAVKPATWPACERLLPHALSCFSEIERRAITLLEAGLLLNQTGYYLIERARYEEAKPLFRRALLIIERELGRDHPETLRTRHSIARWTAEVGDAREALRLFHELLPAQVKAQGLTHPDTLLTRHSIAYWTGEAGDLRTALRLCRNLLENQKSALGPDHPATLITRRNIARWTGESGNAREALDLFRELLPAQEQVQGATHPDTLLTRHDIGHWIGEVGDSRVAVRLCSELLPDRVRVHGSGHPATLGTRHSVAYWTGEAGDAHVALTLSRELLMDRMRVQSPDHPDILITRRDIARWTGETGDAREALRLFQELLPDQERIQGPDHPDTLGTRHSAAHWTGRAGEAHEALRLCRELLPDQIRIQGRGHHDTLNTLHSVAHWIGETGDAPEALRLFRELLPAERRALGSQHPATLSTGHSIAYWTAEVGDAREALRLFRLLLTKRLAVLGPEHPATLETQRQIARLEVASVSARPLRKAR
jgi:tetratricopeptide (TPR) repeat protein